MSAMTRSQIKAEANAFRIWREGVGVKWHCTISEMASAVGLHENTVRRICNTRGWPILGGKHDTARAVEVDTSIQEAFG